MIKKEPFFRLLVISGTTSAYVYVSSEAKMDYVGNVIYENGAFKRMLVEGGPYYFYADSEAEGTRHTQLGTREGRKGSYKQAREFDEGGKPVNDIDFTDHGRPQNHPNPHRHKYKDNPTGGTRQRSKVSEPLN